MGKRSKAHGNCPFAKTKECEAGSRKVPDTFRAGEFQL
jgi:hypothetical protein